MLCSAQCTLHQQNYDRFDYCDKILEDIGITANYWFASPPSSPVSCGRASHMLAEGFGEVAGALEAAGAGDFQDGLVGILQKNAGPGDPVADQVLDGGEAQQFAEAAQAFPLADIGVGCQLRHRDGAVIIFLEIGQHLFDAVILEAVHGGGLRLRYVSVAINIK